jgi:uncharacterized protein YegP (UPF0339 family)
MGKFEKIKTDAGFHFVLKAANDEIIGTSEVYTSEAACDNGIRSVVVNAPIAALEDKTAKEVVEAKNPKFVLDAEKGGKFHFNLTATNGEIVLSSQSYAAVKSALNGIESVRTNAAGGFVAK